MLEVRQMFRVGDVYELLASFEGYYTVEQVLGHHSALDYRAMVRTPTGEIEIWRADDMHEPRPHDCPACKAQANWGSWAGGSMCTKCNHYLPKRPRIRLVLAGMGASEADERSESRDARSLRLASSSARGR